MDSFRTAYVYIRNFFAGKLCETDEGSEEYVLSPAYDLLPVNVIMPEDKEQFALAINGKKSNIHKKDFLVFAEECHMTRNSAEKMISLLVSKQEKFLAMCQNSLLPEHLKKHLKRLIKERVAILQ